MGGGRIIPRGHGVVDACLQVSQPTQRADDPPTALLDHVCDVAVGRHLDLEKARLATLVGAIEIDTLKEDQVIVHIEIEWTPQALDTRDRSRLDLLPLNTTFDRLVDVILHHGGADARMDFCGQVL